MEFNWFESQVIWNLIYLRVNNSPHRSAGFLFIPASLCGLVFSVVSRRVVREPFRISPFLISYILLILFISYLLSLLYSTHTTHLIFICTKSPNSVAFGVLTVREKYPLKIDGVRWGVRFFWQPFEKKIPLRSWSCILPARNGVLARFISEVRFYLYTISIFGNWEICKI